MKMPLDIPAAVRRARIFGAADARDLKLAAALALTLGIALTLRLYGLEWDSGYPFTPHPDERAILMKVAELSPPALGDVGSLLNADESPWNPRWFPYGSFPLYLLKGFQVVLSSLPGVEIHDLRVLGRALSAFADTAAVALVYLLGARLYGRREGLLASALLALSVLHVQLSHFFAVDTIMAACAVTALYFLSRVAKDGRPRDSLAAGAAIGLGLATKISLSPIYAAFLMAHVIAALGLLNGAAPERGFADRAASAVTGLVMGGAVSVVVFAVVQPYAFLDFGRFLADTTEQSEMVRRIRDYPYTRQYIDTIPYWYHVRQLATWGLGLPLGIVAWAGLLYASLRGMRLVHGLAYLAAGWVLPAALLLLSNSVPMIMLAAGIAVLALAATLPVRSVESRANVLLLSWVAPYLLITGAFQVKFLRYLAPVTPFLVLFGSQMLFDLWDWTRDRLSVVRPALAAGLLLLLAATGFYAAAYAAVYNQDHPAIRTARWIHANAPEGSVILKEHWEEGIPGLHGHVIRELPLYDDDTGAKIRQIAEELAGADYLVFYSNRLYGTIPRLPERYPVSAEYYRLLFSGRLGYQVVDAQTSYPSLAGVSFVDDTLSRPALPAPGLANTAPAGLALDLGFADESFTVYDHPMTLVFENTARHTAQAIEQTLRDGSAGRSDTAQARPLGLMLSDDEADAQRAGGTWADIVRPSSWAAQYPVLAWLLVVQIMAMLAFPIAFVLFRRLPDRGYILAKPLGILLVSLAAWLLASYRWMSFSQGSITVSFILLAAISLPVLVGARADLAAFARRRWRTLLAAEAVFILAFLAFVLVRMANPDLWHPYLGGEKPMDMAYLNAVLKSSHMPPYDPWFGGGYINYYYWGQFIVSGLVHATGIDTAAAFNLAVPLFFALTAAAAYSIVYNLASATTPRAESPPRSRLTRMALSPVSAGLTGAAFVAVLGNLDGAVQVVSGAWRGFVQNMPAGGFDFWRSTRVMLPDPPGHEITEFPFFTFLFADLHAHLMALPFTLLAIGVSLAVVMGGRPSRSVERAPRWSAAEIARLTVLGIVVGALRLINTWDFPLYLLIAAAAVFVAAYFRNGGLSLMVIVESGAKVILVAAAGYVAFLPYHAAYETFFTSVEGTTNQTVLWQFLLIHGLFVFVLASYFLIDTRSSWLPLLRWLRRRITPGPAVESPGGEAAGAGYWRPAALGFAALLAGWLAVAFLVGFTGSAIPFAALLLALVGSSALKTLRSHRPDAPIMTFAAVLAAAALAVVIGLDIVRVEGDIDRMNSVFKFYLQVWTLLAVASAYLLWHMARAGTLAAAIAPPWRSAWVWALALLVLGAAIYPALGTQARLRTRFDVLPMTLDGMAYMRTAAYNDPNGQIDLSHDYDGIQWLRAHVEGSPIILEGLTPNYRWGGRVSVYTGLPTIVGWQWHQEQQRWGYRWAVGERAQIVNRIYQTTDAAEAIELLRKHDVEYIYVGQLERLYYPPGGLAKFDADMVSVLDEVYKNDQVKIYKLRPLPTAP